MYSHAILAWWGQSVYLSLADHDEYLALTHPEKAANVQDLMANCFNGLSQVNNACSCRTHNEKVWRRVTGTRLIAPDTQLGALWARASWAFSARNPAQFAQPA